MYTDESIMSRLSLSVIEFLFVSYICEGPRGDRQEEE